MLGLSCLRVLLLGLAITTSEAIPAGRRDTDSNSTVDLGYAVYQGSVNPQTNVQSFKGIRYAAPPLGELRFRAPEQPLAAQGIQDATTFGSQCFQQGVGSRYANQTAALTAARAGLNGSSEDCLFLNVYAPNGGNGQGLPVMVWIHGGGYTLGASNTFDPAYFYTRPESDYVIVTINYRLGVFGFLAGQEVKDGGALNAGILDQQAALQWVQAHIDKFGGNPEDVTLYGESAGAGSILQHIIANGGNTQPPLFVGAIASSPFEPPQFYYNDTVPQGIYQSLVDSVNCTNSNDTLECLREQDAANLATEGLLIINQQEPGDFLTVPVIDGEFITDRPLEILRSGQFNGKYLWSHRNFNEGIVYGGSSFVPTNIGSNVTLQEQYLNRSKPELSAYQQGQLIDVYDAQTFGSVQVATEKLYSDGTFGCQSVWMARAFQNQSYISYLVIPGFGVHGGDLAFSWNAPQLLNMSAAYAGETQAYTDNINSFVVNHKPLNSDWIAFDDANPTNFVWNVTQGTLAPDNEVRPLDQGFLGRCQLWSDLAPTLPL
ncbi:hypothetical protein FFLO_05115 [Filobasidium floriforme]|uniref:Carboxylic ester hydrolase n=1 Tax=Filobasidium floriforme TaxID=5210 RepID=A0A8K0NP64_9TREE|nr:hypothetical protein FFLO_05115 [Filobasidium floriforme]